VLLYLVASLVVPIPYERWLKRTMASGSPQGAA
jgi:hypothetical protein